ncbi:hypothetical protein DRE_02625 [Drechslerella stenobrocha 248]|uniref:WLM domain-containing protein n=1 Tax=Drechslerella stenobrocha 248 TaxID=1043628 RepID=W7HV46_9PEZI|nr:hypothetical protein DRE_02625 [Drechslerella stenobrocha 248]
MVTTHMINDPDALIGTFFHLTGYSNAPQALDILKRVASLVKPIMRRHGFRIARLAEFYPEMEPNLLGLNTSFPGSRALPIIQLRLRHSHDSRVFLDYDHVVDTMLHELSHCVHGPHDDKFWALFRSLQSEYTGEGFLGNGQALGGAPKGLHNLEAKRKAREAAERRRKGEQGLGRLLGSGSLGPIRWIIEGGGSGSTSTLKPRDGAGHGHGGRSSAPPNSSAGRPSPYPSPQQGAAEAALKRQWDKVKGKGRDTSSAPTRELPQRGSTSGVCSGVRHSTTEAIDHEIAQMHGFESVADMESANEQAIMAAAIDLLEEADREEERLKAGQQSRSPPSGPHSSQTTWPPQPGINRTQSAPVIPYHSKPGVPVVSPGWACPVCTYLNEENHLQCSLCKVERNTASLDDNGTKAQVIAYRGFERQRTDPASLNSSRSTSRSGNGSTGKGKGIDMSTYGGAATSSRAGGSNPIKLNKDLTINGQPTWKCQSCGWLVGQEWWSCGNCGTVKMHS